MKKPNLLVRLWMLITSIFSKSKPNVTDIEVSVPHVITWEKPEPINETAPDPIDPIEDIQPPAVDVAPEVIESKPERYKVSALFKSILQKKLELVIDSSGRIKPVLVAGSGKLEQPLTYISHTELLIFLAEWLKHQESKHAFTSKDLKTLLAKLPMIQGTLSSKQVWRAITKSKYRKEILIVGQHDPALYEINYESGKWTRL